MKELWIEVGNTRVYTDEGKAFIAHLARLYLEKGLYDVVDKVLANLERGYDFGDPMNI